MSAAWCAPGPQQEFGTIVWKSVQGLSLVKGWVIRPESEQKQTMISHRPSPERHTLVTNPVAGPPPFTCSSLCGGATFFIGLTLLPAPAVCPNPAKMPQPSGPVRKGLRQFCSIPCVGFPLITGVALGWPYDRLCPKQTEPSDLQR
jgi:hypothetical protein